MKTKFKLNGLDCANCATELERAIQKIDGVENVSISFMTLKMDLEYDENKKEDVINNIKKTIRKEEPDVTIEEV